MLRRLVLLGAAGALLTMVAASASSLDVQGGTLQGMALPADFCQGSDARLEFTPPTQDLRGEGPFRALLTLHNRGTKGAARDIVAALDLTGAHDYVAAVAVVPADGGQLPAGGSPNTYQLDDLDHGDQTALSVAVTMSPSWLKAPAGTTAEVRWVVTGERCQPANGDGHVRAVLALTASGTSTGSATAAGQDPGQKASVGAGPGPIITLPTDPGGSGISVTPGGGRLPNGPADPGRVPSLDPAAGPVATGSNPTVLPPAAGRVGAGP